MLSGSAAAKEKVHELSEFQNEASCRKLPKTSVSEIIQCDGQTDGRKDWMIAITALSRADMWYKFEINRHILILLVFCIIVFNWKWPK